MVGLICSISADVEIREDTKFQSLFKKAGLKIVRAEIQRGIPATYSVQLLPIKMYALKPDTA